MCLSPLLLLQVLLCFGGLCPPPLLLTAHDDYIFVVHVSTMLVAATTRSCSTELDPTTQPQQHHSQLSSGIAGGSSRSRAVVGHVGAQLVGKRFCEAQHGPFHLFAKPEGASNGTCGEFQQ